MTLVVTMMTFEERMRLLAVDMSAIASDNYDGRVELVVLPVEEDDTTAKYVFYSYDEDGEVESSLAVWDAGPFLKHTCHHMIRAKANDSEAILYLCESPRALMGVMAF